MTIGGCTGQEWPIDCWFDDDGASITQCVDLNCGGCPLAPLLPEFLLRLLTAFEGIDASGVWKITISDNFCWLMMELYQTVGFEVMVNLPQVSTY